MLDQSLERAPARLFEFVDYRDYLRWALARKRESNPAFTESAFVRKAGLSSNSRGYFKLVIQGKRNLTPVTIRGFSEALGLSSRESIFFENLVNFNQALRPKDKDYYFHRLMASTEGNQSKQSELLLSQYSYCSKWYLVAVRELVGLADFKEDAGWITAKLRGKIKREQAIEALDHLLRLDMISRNKQGRLVQCAPLVHYKGGVFDAAVQSFHLEMIERAKESLRDDPYSERRASALTLSCSHEHFDEMVKMIDTFRTKVNRKFGADTRPADTLFQVCIQLFQLTPISKAKREEVK